MKKYILCMSLLCLSISTTMYASTPDSYIYNNGSEKGNLKVNLNEDLDGYNFKKDLETTQTNLGYIPFDLKDQLEDAYHNPSLTNTINVLSNPITLVITTLIATATAAYFGLKSQPVDKKTQAKMDALEAQIKELQALQQAVVLEEVVENAIENEIA